MDNLHDIIKEGYLEDILSDNNISLTREELLFLDAFYMKEYDDLKEQCGDRSIEEYLCCMLKNINEKMLLGISENCASLEFARNEVLARDMPDYDNNGRSNV